MQYYILSLSHLYYVMHFLISLIILQYGVMYTLDDAVHRCIGHGLIL